MRSTDDGNAFPAFDFRSVFVVPGETPAPLLERWNQEIVKVLNDAGVRDGPEDGWGIKKTERSQRRPGGTESLHARVSELGK